MFGQSALKSLLVIADRSFDDERASEWLEQLAVTAALGPLSDCSAAHSRRPLAARISIVRPNLQAGQADNWPNIAASAGSMVDPIETSMREGISPGYAVWLDASAEQVLATSFAAHSFGGEGAISAIAFDVTPTAVRHFSQPFGRQALARARAGLEDAGVSPFFIARCRSLAETMTSLGAAVITDVPLCPGPRRSPAGRGPVREDLLDLAALAAEPQGAKHLGSLLCERTIDLCGRRAAGDLRVTICGAVEHIARSTPYLEDLVSCRIALRLEPSKDGPQGIPLTALGASPLLRLAFDNEFVAGSESHPDALDLREMRKVGHADVWALAVARALNDQIGHGLKDIRLGNRDIRLDIR
jgi:hypothetical protein